LKTGLGFVQGHWK